MDKKGDDYRPYGPNSLELFLSSLGACIGVFAKRGLERYRIPYNTIFIRASADLFNSPAPELKNIKVKVETDAELADKREVLLRFMKGCPLHNTILNTRHIGIELEK